MTEFLCGGVKHSAAVRNSQQLLITSAPDMCGNEEGDNVTPCVELHDDKALSGILELLFIPRFDN